MKIEKSPDIIPMSPDQLSVNGHTSANVRLRPATFHQVALDPCALTELHSLELERNTIVNWLTCEIASEHLFLQLLTPRVLFAFTNEGILCKPWGQLFSLHVWVQSHLHFCHLACTHTDLQRAHSSGTGEPNAYHYSLDKIPFTKTNSWNDNKVADRMAQVSFQVIVFWSEEGLVSVVVVQCV